MTRALHLERERIWGRPVHLTRLPGSGPPALSLQRVHSAAGQPRQQSCPVPFQPAAAIAPDTGQPTVDLSLLLGLQKCPLSGSGPQEYIEP